MSPGSPLPLKVLLVEDNPADARLVAELLREAGPTAVVLTHAGRLIDALARLRDRGFNAILLDLSLPDSQGLETFVKTHAQALGAPIVVLTGLHDEDLAVEAVREGAQDYLVKGQVDGHRLYHSLRYAVERHLGEQRRAAQYAVTRALGEAATLADAASRVLRAMCESLDWEVGVLWVVDPAAAVLRCADLWHAPDVAPGELERLTRETAFARGAGAPGQVWERGEAIWYRDVGQLSPDAFPRMRHAAAAGLHGAVGFPIRSGSDIIGVIEFFSRELREPDADLLEMTAALGSQVAQFIVRWRAEETLRDREERFRQLAENIEEVFFLMDAQFRETLYINPAYEATWGRSCRSLYENPLSFLEPIPPEDHAAVLAYIAQVQQGADAGRVEFRVVRPDGQTRWVLVHAVPIRNAQGEVYRISGVALDITERKRAEAALRASEEQFRLLLNSTAEGIYGLDLAGNCTFCNPATARLLGYQSPDDLLGKPIHPLSHHTRADGSPYPAEQCRIYEAFQRGEGTHVDDEVFWRADGTSFPVEYWSYPIRQRGAVVGAVVTFLDITERRRSHEALEESEARYRKLTDASFDGIGIMQEGRMVDVNRGFAAMFGYTVEDAIGRPATDFITEESRPDVQRRIIEGVEGSYEFVGLRKDGRKIQLEATARNHTVAGRPGRVTALRDVTEKRLLEQQFRQAQKMEAVGRLAGGVAHDFNNLLTVITSYSELLLEDLNAADPRRTDLEEIRKAAGIAATLTRQLLAFSRQQVLEPRVLSLNDVVTGAEKMLKRLIGDDVRLVTTLAPAAGAVRADVGQIEQVIMNLVVNARDAMPDGGDLTLETANVALTDDYVREHLPVKAGRYVMLAVSDTGVGMDVETQARIFEPFFTTKEPGKGTGLGLATVYGIVKQSGGFIWVYSEPGRGTSFKIYLPSVDDEAAGTPAARPTDVRGGTETVLLVEDAAALRDIARRVLERWGYTVLEAPDGRTALALAAQHRGPIHLLLTDVVMPEMNGRVLAERLTALRSGTKVLYMSGYADDAVMRRGVLEHGMAYLQKPFTPDGLAKKVREVLDA